MMLIFRLVGADDFWYIMYIRSMSNDAAANFCNVTLLDVVRMWTVFLDMLKK